MNAVIVGIYSAAWTFIWGWFVYQIAYDRGWNKGFDQAVDTIKEAVASNTARSWEKRNNLGRGKSV